MQSSSKAREELERSSWAWVDTIGKIIWLFKTQFGSLILNLKNDDEKFQQFSSYAICVFKCVDWPTTQFSYCRLFYVNKVKAEIDCIP